MDFTEITGILASIFTAASMLPQLVKLLKEKKAKDISLGMLCVLLIGLALWVGYGCLKKDLVILISNAVSFAINLTTLFFSLKYKKK